MALVYQYVIMGLMSFLGFGSCQMDLAGLAQLSMATGGLSGQNRVLGLASMTGMTGDMSPADLAILNNAVKTIVGKHAAPGLAMIRFASTQGGPPITLGQMFPYIGFMVQLAKDNGLQMDDGSIRFPGAPSSAGYGTQGKTGQGVGLTFKEMEKIISDRARAWFINRSMARSVGLGGMGGMAGMGGIGGFGGMGGIMGGFTF